ncbi:unnamed protein product [Rangifer tarandus platyrhynchus]|uniref:Large ribosomal subunit protein P2 n=1 Tax=Rangifer tarandus platyrhynchus TaxID=3082113 RepID=A0ABN9A7J8_RANTA|nr:unnamed protein product [Rangifer tarandus platyrhynchus]
MRYVAAYLLAALGGNSSPSAKDIKKILDSVGIEADDNRLNKVISELNGKNIEDVIARVLASWSVCPRAGLLPPLLPQEPQHLLWVLLQPQQRRRRRRRRKSQRSQMTTWALAC